MKRVQLVRHGQTSWNDEGRIQGWSHVGLNETGRAQAREVGRYLAAEHPEIEVIYSSDLPRALETAEVIAEVSPTEDLSIRTDAVWRERNFGVYQGFDAREFFATYPEFALLAGGNDAAWNRPEQGESYVEFDRRVRNGWYDFIRTVFEEAVCVVTHSGVIRQIIASIENVDFVSAIEEIPLTNCSVTEITYDEESEVYTISDANANHFLDEKSRNQSC